MEAANPQKTIELSTLEKKNRSTLRGMFWPIREGLKNWLPLMTDTERCRQEPWLAMQGRPFGCFVDERTGDLGPYVRWLIACALILQRAYPKLTWKKIVDTIANGPLQGQRDDEQCGDQRAAPAAQEQQDHHDGQGEHEGLLDHDPHKHGAQVHRLVEQRRMRTIRDVFEPLLGLDDYELRESFETVFFQDANVRRFAERYRHGRLFDRIVDRLNAGRGDRPPLTRTQLLDVPNLRGAEPLEPRTLLQFEHWLVNGIHPPNDDLADLMCEELLRSPVPSKGDRNDQLEHVLHTLRSPRSPADPRVVINIYAKNCWTGLRAFATALLEQLETKREANPDVPLGLIYLRLSRSSSASAAPTPASVVRKLRRAFGLAVEVAEEGRSRPIDLHADTADIARALTIYPTILVIDGLSNPGGPMSDLFDMMRNMHWVEFLRVLMQPHQPTQVRRGASYQSRLVVLSSDPVPQMQPWMMMDPRRLAGVPTDVDARALLEPSPARRERLAALARRLGASESSESLEQLFPLDAGQCDALFRNRAKHQLPTELDLALACLHSGDDLRAMWQLHRTGDTVDLVNLRRLQVSRWMKSLLARPEGFADMLAIKFVCCAVNGLRISTLKRCLNMWLELVNPYLTADQVEKVIAYIADGGPECLVDRHPQILVLNTDEDVEAIGLRQRRFELQAFPDSEDTPSISDNDRPLIDIRLESIRELMLAEMINAQPELTAHAKTNPLQVARGEFELINLLLAEEALRQSNAKLRNLEGHEFRTPAVYRRLVQCVFHGLLSHAYDNREANSSGRPQPSLPGMTLPAEPFRRFRYLYSFVFRHGIENAPEWTLSRGFVRSEMRFALVAMFAHPQWGMAVLGQLHRMNARRRLLHSARDLTATASPGWLLSEGTTAWITRDSVLQIDILEALSRSAHDTGRHALSRSLGRFVRRQRRARTAEPAVDGAWLPSRTLTNDPLAHLNNITDSVATLRTLTAEASTLGAPGLKHDPVEHAFQKLAVDSRLARAQNRTAAAMCRHWLEQHGLVCAPFEDVGRLFVPPLADAPSDASAKALFETDVLKPLADRVLRVSGNARDRVALADMISRWGESEAGLADAMDAWQQQARPFLTAYGLLWIADRVRSFASGVDDSVFWPRVSSHAMRCFIRVSLKLARIQAADGPANPAAQDDARRFYAQARRRMDVYTSHLFRLPRERLAMLLLMASAARVWAELGDREAPIGRKLEDLRASMEYLAQAEVLLFKLGFRDTLACRFFFERSKTYRRLVEFESTAQRETYRQLRKRDLDLLERVAGNDPFWRRIVSRMREEEDLGPHASWHPLAQKDASTAA